MSLLDEMMNETKDAPKGSLLDEVREEAELQATAWIPAKPDFKGPKGIEGEVIAMWFTESDHADAKTGVCPQIPNVVVRDAEGTNWGVKGFHKVLRTEIEDKGVEKGDFAAFLYLGQKASAQKGRRPTELYRVGVRKSAAKAADGGPGF